MPFMPVQIFIQAAKMKEEIFLSIQNDQKWIKNFVIFHKGRKGARLQKMMWDYGTLGL